MIASHKLEFNLSLKKLRYIELLYELEPKINPLSKFNFAFISSFEISSSPEVIFNKVKPQVNSNEIVGIFSKVKLLSDLL